MSYHIELEARTLVDGLAAVQDHLHAVDLGGELLAYVKLDVAT